MRTWTFSLLLAVSMGATGCFNAGSTAKPLPPPSPLRMELEDFTAFVASRVEQAADNILEANDSAAIDRNTLFWRMRVIPMCRRTLILGDDDAVLLELWLIARRMTHFFAAGAGREFFGKSTPLALAATTEIEERIRQIATRRLPANEFAAAEKNIADFAAAHPVSNRLDVSPDAEDSWTTVLSSTLDKPFSMLEMPLSHVSPTTGLSDAALAAHRIAATLEQMETTAQYYPDNLRWQTDLLVLELEQSMAVKSSLESLKEIGGGATSIAATAATLPANLRKELSGLIDDVDQKQTALQVTLDKAHATAREARVAVEGMDKTLVQLDTVVQATGPTAQSLTRMGDSLTAAFGAFTKMMEVLKAPSPDPTPAAAAGPPFDVNDYGRNAEKITATMVELNAVLAKVEDLTDRDRFSALVGGADVAVQSTLDYLFVGIAALVLFIFLVALGYRFLTRSMLPRSAR